MVRNSLALLQRREDDASSAQDLLIKLHENVEVEFSMAGRSENGVLDYIFFTTKRVQRQCLQMCRRSQHGLHGSHDLA